VQLSDKITGGCLIALGVAAIAGAMQQPGVPGQDVGPSVFPTIIGAGLVLCGLLIALGIGAGFEEPETLVEAEDGQVVKPPPSYGGLRAFIPPLLLVFYVLVADTLGFIITAAIMVAIVTWAMGGRPKLIVPMAIITPFAVATIFINLLRVPLPEGIFALPW